MTCILVRCAVEDLAKWRTVLEAGAALRKSIGSKGVPSFRRATKRDVSSTFEVIFLDNILQLPV